jgi:hypothetical protein
MAQAGYTPIQLYYSTTSAAAPTSGNLTNGELAININNGEMALYAKNASGTVTRLINNPAGLKYPTADGTSNQVLVTNGSGVLSFSTVDSLPSQTGNAGKYLFTNGTVASWENTGASAGGVIWENSLVVSSNYTLTTAKNGFSVGPITINSGVTVTVPSGQRWVIL